MKAYLILEKCLGSEDMQKQSYKIAELVTLFDRGEGTIRQYLSRAEFANCINGGRKNGFKSIALDENEFELLRRRINRDFRQEESRGKCTVRS